MFDIEMEDNRRPLLQFLDALREHYLHLQNHPLLIDFSNTQRFVASGTLLFYAELCRLIAFSGGRVRLRCNEPRNQLASQVLQQIEIYKLCEHPWHGRPTHRDVVHWRVARGHIINATLYAPAIEAHEGRLAEPLIDGVFRGLAEAMANAVEHAYIRDRDDGMEYSGTPDWWVFSQVKDGHLVVALCDLGIGIPQTLPLRRPGIVDRLKAKLGAAPSDADCISAAVEDSRSRTGQPQRGKGLGNIIDVVDDAAGGVALVFSNRGCYILRDGKHAQINFRDSILGTLVFWRIPLKGAETHAI